MATIFHISIFTSFPKCKGNSCDPFFWSVFHIIGNFSRWHLRTGWQNEKYHTVRDMDMSSTRSREEAETSWYFSMSFFLDYFFSIILFVAPKDEKIAVEEITLRPLAECALSALKSLGSPEKRFRKKPCVFTWPKNSHITDRKPENKAIRPCANRRPKRKFSYDYPRTGAKRKRNQLLTCS